MDEYLGWMLNLTHWHWLVIGLALGAIEMVGTSFFLIFPAISAVLVAGVVYIEPGLDWRLQLLVFAALSVLSTALSRNWIRRWRGNDAPMTVNVRGQTHVGRRVRLQSAMVHGEGRIQIDDTWWKATAMEPHTIETDTLVEILGADGAVLKVRPVSE